MKIVKGRVWSTIMFCVWLAFAVKIVKGREWSKIMFCVWLAFAVKRVKGRVWSKIVLCMACFCKEDSRGDDRTAKFSLVYEIPASKARR